jgi:hypothetical protein
MRTKQLVCGYRWKVACLMLCACSGGCRARFEKERDIVYLESAARPAPSSNGRASRADKASRPGSDGSRRDVREALVPILDCVEEVERGRLRAHWGYLNDCDEVVHTALGAENRFTPAPVDRGQPEDFEPGEHTRVFSMTFKKGSSLSWSLEGNEATASADSPRCKPAGHSAGRSAPCGSANSAGAASPMRDCCCSPDAAVPSGEDADAGAADSECPDEASFPPTCSGSPRCGPYTGPLHTECGSPCPPGCTGEGVYSVPIPTLAECVEGKWVFSPAPHASEEVCGPARPCICAAGSGADPGAAGCAGEAPADPG